MTVTKQDKALPIKTWCQDIEEGAMAQAINLSELPFAFHHIAIMPDAHQGYGMPIGGIMATNGVVVPNAVGVDIGCGMCAVQTHLKEIEIPELKEIMGKTREIIPVGFAHNKTDVYWTEFDNAPDHKVIQNELAKAKKQLGTLGGGNHFIEIQKGNDGFIWLMIHSGSRNFGYQIAKYHHKIAKDYCQQFYADIPDLDLSFLPMDLIEGKNYIEDMNFALKFAAKNRSVMMENLIDVLKKIMGEYEYSSPIDIHHNYASIENHFNKNVLIHRKGATLARKETIGIIPGSQGTSSYIVGGLGSVDSFYSCSHGAGRKMARKAAQRNLNLEEEQKKLDDKGILHAIRGERDLDEAAGAYKDIDQVMEAQKDLVEIKVKLRPLGVIKG